LLIESSDQYLNQLVMWRLESLTLAIGRGGRYRISLVNLQH